MIPKVLISGYDETMSFPSSVLLPEYSKGFDRDVLRKQASIFENDYDKFERRPGYTYIHLISVASGDHYGANSRADYYNWGPGQMTVPLPEKGADPVIMLDGGIQKYHNDSFMKHGAVYTEHRTPHEERYKHIKPQGYVVIAGTNPDMYRGELIIGVKTTEWADDIQRLSKGTPIKFSIGAAAPFDICSICGRKAHKDEEHCDHYKSRQVRGSIDEAGRQAYVVSDKLTYYDISRVRSPAEKTAFSIRKVAGDLDRDLLALNPVMIPRDVVRGVLKSATAQKRFDTLRKLSAIEKNIMAMAGAGSLDPVLVQSCKKADKAEDVEKRVEPLLVYIDGGKDREVLKELKDQEIVMSPDEFLSLLLSKMDREGFGITGDSVKRELPGMLTQILESDDVDCFCEDDVFDPSDSGGLEITIDLRNEGWSGVDDTYSNGVLDHLSGSGELTTPIPSIIVYQTRGGVHKAASREYASYLVSALSDASDKQKCLALLRALV